MNYDPQRSHRRPRPPEAGPSPVDALLEGPDSLQDPESLEGPEFAGPESAASERAVVDSLDETRPDPSGAPATPPVDRPGDTTDIAPRPLPEFVTPERRGGTLRAVALVALVASVVAVLVWLRRHRRSS